MNRVQLLKLAYARGAFLALQEAGYHEKVAEDLALKIADRDALDVLEDVGIGAGVGGLGGAALGAGAGALTGRFAKSIPGEARLLSMTGARNPNLRRALGASGYSPELTDLPYGRAADLAGMTGAPMDVISGFQKNPEMMAQLQSGTRVQDPFSMPARGALQYGTAGLGAGALGGGLVGGLAGE
jgi:hypothetical protein